MAIPKTYYQTVIPSGSTCCCRALEHYNDDCGHKHKSYAAAEKCWDKLTKTNADGSTSAYWYNSSIIARVNDTSGGRVINDYETGGAFARPQDELQLAGEACTC